MEPGVGLGHRRLSIIELASGTQPLFSEDGTVLVADNGESYNFQALSTELEHAWHLFRTRCDPEVIAHAREKWGEACVTRFRGTFAFGIWDHNRRRLYLTSDRVGIEPLHCAELSDGTIIFASELKALLKHPGLSRALDTHAITDYFAFGYVPEPIPIIDQAPKLSSGHTLTVKFVESLPRERSYLDVPFVPVTSRRNDDVADELMKRVRASIRLLQIIDVPLRAFPSGATDSGAIVCMMAGLNPADPVVTCSIVFNDAAYNESEYAEIVAERYATKHNVETVESDDFHLIDTLSDSYDKPYADGSAIPTYRVCKFARKHVMVAPSGGRRRQIVRLSTLSMALPRRASTTTTAPFLASQHGWHSRRRVSKDRLGSNNAARKIDI